MAAPVAPSPPAAAPRAPAPGPDAFAPTAAPGTFPPIKSPLKPPANGPGKAGAHDATLRPDGDNEETHEVASPPLQRPTAPTGTLLGIPAQEIAASLMPAMHGDSEKRTTQPLSIGKVADEAKRAGQSFDEDAQTEVQAPATIVDDGPTRRNERIDRMDPMEDAQTLARPAPRSRPLDRGTTPPTGVPTRQSSLPPTRQTAKPTTPTRPTPAPLPTRPTRLPSGNLPEPLPPPPSRPGNDVGAFPSIEPQGPMSMEPTPAIPTLALPPMPEHPKSGSIVDSVKYLPPLAKAIWARKKAQDAIRTLLHGDQRLLDSVLRDLGRVAREEHVVVPAIAEEMRAVAAEEERRNAAERAAADAESAMKKEDERWHFDEGERNAELARREAELKVVDEDLRKHADARRRHEADRAKVDAQIRALEKKAAAADAKAAKADATPPEKGGGANTAANARAEAAEARTQATALIPERDKARAEIEKLDVPIGELTKKITDGRATVVQKKRELQEARAMHDKSLADLAAARDKANAERDAAERELTQRFVTAGTMLNLNRVEHPKLAPLFARVDELRNGVNAREAAIVRLESERRLYDRAAVQKGLLTVGIAAGALILIAIILVVVVAR